MSFVWFLLIGLLAGFLGGTLMKGRGFGLVGNLLVGIVGAIVGGFVFGLLGLSADNLIGSLITATAGAVLFLAVAGFVMKKQHA